jgi:uncharacterized protein YbjT (DUF2867 family)
MILVTGASGSNGTEIMKRLAAAVTSGVRDATGKDPRSFEAFANDYAAVFP